MTPQGPFTRYLDHVNERGCWITWLVPNSSGYGTVWLGTKAKSRRKVGLHVASYLHFVGDIPAGLVLDHVECSDRLCFNFAHLQPVTQMQNVHRTLQRLEGQPFPCGHARTVDNIIRNGNNSYRCRECNKSRCATRYYEAVMQ